MRSAASPASLTAPGMPSPPPIINTWPKSPLCAPRGRRLRQRRNTRLDIRRLMASACGRQCSGTSRPSNTIAPLCSAPSPANSPAFRPTKVTVRSASTAVPITCPVSPWTPVGISSARTLAVCAFMADTALANSPLTSRSRPLPSRASTIRLASSSRAPSHGMTTPPSAAKSP